MIDWDFKLSLVKRVFKYTMIFLVLCECNGIEEKDLTVQNIEIFKSTPAWEAALYIEEDKTIRLKNILSENSLLVNYQEPLFGTTLLMRAISTEKYDAVKILLEYGANPDIISKTGTTALFRAVSYSWDDTNPNKDDRFVKILLDYDADPNLSYCSPTEDEVISPIECGTSPLMHATSRGINKVKLLVEYGADINYRTKTQRTAAIDALLMQSVDVAYYLIVEKKAEVSQPFYFYNVENDTVINYKKPHYPIELLENWLFELGSEKHKKKLAIIKEFEKQGQDYWSMGKHPKTVERIKKIYPNNWKEYLNRY